MKATNVVMILLDVIVVLAGAGITAGGGYLLADDIVNTLSERGSDAHTPENNQ